MKTFELILACERALEEPTSQGQIQLLLQRKAPRGERLHLCGRKSPKGWFVSETERGVLARFDAREVMVWCRKAVDG